MLDEEPLRQAVGAVWIFVNTAKQAVDTAESKACKSIRRIKDWKENEMAGDEK